MLSVRSAMVPWRTVRPVSRQPAVVTTISEHAPLSIGDPTTVLCLSLKQLIALNKLLDNSPAVDTETSWAKLPNEAAAWRVRLDRWCYCGTHLSGYYLLFTFSYVLIVRKKYHSDWKKNRFWMCVRNIRFLITCTQKKAYKKMAVGADSSV